MHDCLIAFGSNQGNSVEMFEQSTQRISEIENVQLLATSKLLSTEPVGGPAGQDAYLNAVIRIQTELGAVELHRELVKIETELGRERRERWGSRKIDLDLLLFDLLQLQTANLTLPHPRMSFRRFVLEPAKEVASDMVHATSGLTIQQLVKALDERENLVLLAALPTEFVEHEKLIRNLLPAGWRLAAVSDEATLKQTMVQNHLAKLVCFVENSNDENSKLDPLLQAAVSYPGPTLRLHADLKKSETGIKAEIKAAFEAIKPLG